MVRGLKERPWWDPRVYQWPVPLFSFGTAVWSGIHCAKAAFSVDPRTKVIPIFFTACGCAGVTTVFYKKVFLRNRETEWGTWKTCIDCEKAHGAAAGVVLGGFIPGLFGGLASSGPPKDLAWGRRAIGRQYNRVGRVLNAFPMAERGIGMMTIGGVLGFTLIGNKLVYDELMWKKKKTLKEKMKDSEKVVS